ncbi:MAG: DUF2326 domain-containing protein [Patescibacteria group bacterium]|nr:DUF2326 domain-containing protein [Patescibacteria group bacterium]
MKISKIYSNDPRMKPILFRPGFNVVYGDVEKKSAIKNEHNIGKTLLVDLIDFLLLKRTSKKNRLFKYKDKLGGWCFFMELELEKGKFLTIKRSLDSSSLASFKLHSKKNQDFSNEIVWDEKDTKLYAKKSKDSLTILEDLLGFDVLQNYSVRFFLSYLLRTQYDYSDVFKMPEFQGLDVDWKPPLFSLLGFEEKYVIEKYRIQYEIDNNQRILKTVLGSKKDSSGEAYVLKAAITEKEREKMQVSQQVDKFDFYLKEQKLNKQLIEEVETKISKLNSERYRLDYEINRIKEALREKVIFSIDDVQKVFEDVKIYFPEKMKKDYDDLIKFNLSISKERSKYLHEDLEAYAEYLSDVTSELKKLNQQKEEDLSFLRGTDTFRKYKQNQQDLFGLEEQINQYKARLDSLGTAENYEKKIEVLREESKDVAKSLKKVIDAGNRIHGKISAIFTDIFKKTMHGSALLVVRPNNAGNPEFESITISKEAQDELTGQSEGYTSKKVQCAAFVLSILSVYSSRKFYKFAYHDGLFESWGNNPKKNFTNEVRKICKENDLQYIVSMIKSDVPEDFSFNEGEIILSLDDKNKLLGFSF